MTAKKPKKRKHKFHFIKNELWFYCEKNRYYKVPPEFINSIKAKGKIEMQTQLQNLLGIVR